MELKNISTASTASRALEGAVESPKLQDLARTGVLSGAGVTIRQTTDFERLIAELDLKNDEQQDKLRRSQFSAALVVLAGRHEGITGVQQAALEDYAAKVAAYENALAEEAAATGNVNAIVTELDIAIATLEKMVENARKTPEERQAEIEKKERLTEEGLEEVAEEREDVAEGESEETVEESEEIKAQRALVAELELARDAALAEQKLARENVNSAKEAMNGALAGLDQTTSLVVADAVRLAGKIIAAAAAAQKEDPRPVEEEVNAVVAALGEYADKIEEMREDELAEKIAKIEKGLDFVIRSEKVISPADFPEYEQKV